MHIDCRHLAGQGATEYLVLLAVVLIVALVSVALLGFFPGMASDAQATQSKAYWAGASPIAILEWDAMARSASAVEDITMPYLRLKNTGAYPLRITKVLGGDSRYLAQFWNGNGPLGCPGSICNLSNYIYLAPGEETYLADTNWAGQTHYNVPVERYISFYPTAASSNVGGFELYAASSICGRSPPYGSTVVKNFGFEYIEYVEGQQITKRQVGKDLIIKCSQPPA